MSKKKGSKPTKMKNSLIHIVKKVFDKNPDSVLSHKQVCVLIDIRENALRKLVFDVLQDLAHDGFLQSHAHGVYSLSIKNGLAEGTIELTARGAGFVVTDDEESDIFIAPQNLGQALNGDRVRVRIFKRGKTRNEGEVIAVISAASDFVLNSTTPITGFSTVKKGITLVNTNGTTGVTSTPHYFWGTASNASKLGGFSATDFVRAGAANFSTGLSVSDAGITVGDQNDLRIWVENGNRPIIENQLGEDITFRIKTVSANIDVSKINVTGVYPVTTGDIELGAPSLSWKQVYATKFYGSLQGNVLKSDGVTVLIDHSAGTYKGNLVASDLTTAYNATTKTFTGSFVGNITGNLTGSITGNAGSATTISGVSAAEAATAGTIPIRNLSGNILANRFVGIADKADQLLVDATYRSTSITATGDTIPARNGAGDIYAVKFRGTATAAEYADLAEKYLADQEYEVGTVVSIGGEQEVTACTVGDRAIGVVSTNPAFMMNSELENGTYIALKGRVPVKVIGSVKKGDKLIAASNGTAQVAAYGSHSDIFAISLETNTVLDEKVIEALVL
jgi:hypothetical protein